MNFIDLFIKRKPTAAAIETALSTPEHELGPIVLKPEWEDVVLGKKPMEGFRTIDDYPTTDNFVSERTAQLRVGDAIFTADAKTTVTADAAVSGQGGPSVNATWSAYTVPDVVMQWFNAQSFIGYQACALMQQHWLVDKACRMPGEDAIRNGYDLSVMNEADPEVQGLGVSMDDLVARVRELDKDFKIRDNLIDLWRFTQTFGIRVCLFQVDSDDVDYYSKPFNIDGVTKGSYKGIKQIDPYWMMPVLDGVETRDPSGLDFYVPSYWVIGGKKYHKSHLVIGRASEPADILKPAYIFGGIPLTQRIYERVYAAERTANEGPLLAMSKRLTVLHTDLVAAEAQPQKFMNRMMKWVFQRDNWGVKTVGLDDTVEQFDTSLADLDSVIMNQYQLVAAIAEVPATKLLGTSPKGFQSNGSGEEKNYHEKLESVQTFLSPLLERHHQLAVKSEYGVDVQLEAVWNRVDSYTAAELADLNLKKAQTGETLLNMGAISPDMELKRIQNDPLSGYNHVDEDEVANEEMGASPENEAKLATAQAKETAAAQPAAGTAQGGATDASSMKPDLDRLTAALQPHMETDELDDDTMSRLQEFHALVTGEGCNDLSCEDIRPLLQALAAMLGQPTLEDALSPTVRVLMPGTNRGTLPSVNAAMRTNASTGAREMANGPDRTLDDASTLPGYSDTTFSAKGGAGWSHRNMPKIKVGRMTVVVENVRGSIRSGATLDGTEWRRQMPHHYGYINGVMGADGDELDAFVGPSPESRFVIVINQVEPITRNFDEHKVMFGFRDEPEALQAYTDSYQDGWDGYDSHITFTDLEDFRSWMRTADLNEPATLYAMASV